MNERKDVLLRDCFTFGELISIHASLNEMVDNCLRSGWSNDFVDGRVQGLRMLMDSVMNASVLLGEEPA